MWVLEWLDYREAFLILGPCQPNALKNGSSCIFEVIGPEEIASEVV